MNNNEKTASGVVSTESGSGKIITTDKFNYTKKMAITQGIVEQYLFKGIENAIPASELAEIIGCSSVRHLQKMISVERQNGSLILSCKNGYFLPSDGEKGREEIRGFVSYLRSMALNTLKILKTAKRALTVAEGQMELNVWQNDQE